MKSRKVRGFGSRNVSGFRASSDILSVRRRVGHGLSGGMSHISVKQATHSNGHRHRIQEWGLGLASRPRRLNLFFKLTALENVADRLNDDLCGLGCT